MQKLEGVRFPEEAGVSSQGILDYIAAREKAGLEHHAIWVIRHGKIACKLNYAPYDDHTPHMLFSLSKSFCSAAAGFAVQEGLLAWNTRLIDVLPEKFPEAPSDWLKAITLHDLLMMGSGLKPESDRVNGEDWASLVLACGCDYAPGTHFHYNSHGTYLVSAMVQKVTGQTCRDYLTPRLFEPLGMMNADGSAPDWDCCPMGVNVGGWGLWLSCEQIAPFGQCLLQKGVWDGKQILPREWLDRATTVRIDNSNGAHPVPPNDWSLGYGYQFWMCRGEQSPDFIPRYRGDGMFAQFCIVDEARDMVVCCVSGVPDIGKALDLIYTHLFAAADMAPASEAVQAELQQKLTALAYPWPEHDGSSLPVGTYQADGTTLTITQDKVTVDLTDESFTFAVGCVHPDKTFPACCSMQGGKLHLLLRFLKGPFTLDGTVTFQGDEAILQMGGVGQENGVRTLRRK